MDSPPSLDIFDCFSLKEDLNAPIYLLGLTITTGSLVSIPFLFYSDPIVNKVGVINIFIIALAMYGVRYLGYSFITCAWYAFPFEALEVFTLYLMRVAQAQYIKVIDIDLHTLVFQFFFSAFLGLF